MRNPRLGTIPLATRQATARPSTVQLLVVLLLAALLLTACGSSGGGAAAPQNPGSFTATATSGSSVALTWSASAGATSYSLERRTGDGAFTDLASSLTVTNHSDTTVAPGTQYTYRVRAHNAAGASTGRDSNTVTTPTAGGTDAFDLSVANGTLAGNPGSSATTTVSVARASGFTEPVTLTLEGAAVGAGATGITGTFAPNPVTGASSQLTVTVGSGVPTGTYALTVRGTSGSTQRTAALTIAVTAQANVLLVDDDRSSNNYAGTDGTLSYSDTRYRAMLDALEITYDVYVVPEDDDGPDFETLEAYDTVIWYTGDEQFFDPGPATLTPTDQLVLAAFLDLAERTLVLVSGGYMRLHDQWKNDPVDNVFANDYLCVERAFFDFNNQNFTATGVSGQVTAGLGLQVAGANPHVNSNTGVVLPAADADTLLTVQADPDDSGTTRAVAIATGCSGVGAGASSTAIYVGFPIENITAIGPNNPTALLGRLLEY
jgi:hypothetical protein